MAASFAVQSFGLLQRRPDLSQAEFVAHWRDVHGPLGLRTLPLVRQYVQNYASGELPGVPTATCAGVAETWFETLDDALSLPGSAAYLDGLYRDEPNFMAGGTVFLITREVPALAGPRLCRDAPSVKALVFLRRHPGLSIHEFRQAWAGAHAAERFSRVTPPLAYTRCEVTDECHALIAPPYDGVAELWWSGREELERSWQAGDMRGAFLESLAGIVDASALSGGLYEEGRLLWA